MVLTLNALHGTIREDYRPTLLNCDPLTLTDRLQSYKCYIGIIIIICYILVMKGDVLDPHLSAYQLVSEVGIDVVTDRGPNDLWTVRLRLDDDGNPSHHVTTEGADYRYWEINYCDGDDVKATRIVAAIPPGKRTEPVYWTEAAPSKTLTIYRGKGEIVVGHPNVGTTSHLPVDARTHPTAILPAGCFYAIQAAGDSEGPLVVSGFYEGVVDWERLEVPFQLGAKAVQAAEGTINVPVTFPAALAS